MEFPPLQRHRGLQPLSREHFNGLRHARNLTIAAEAEADQHARRTAVAGFCQAWLDEIQDHFADEERLLIPLIQNLADVQRLLDEHKRLRAFATAALASQQTGADPDPAWLCAFGTLLRDHIRWEERQLFPQVQHAATPQALAALEHEADAIEARRPGSRRRKPVGG